MNRNDDEWETCQCRESELQRRFGKSWFQRELSAGFPVATYWRGWPVLFYRPERHAEWSLTDSVFGYVPLWRLGSIYHDTLWYVDSPEFERVCWYDPPHRFDDRKCALLAASGNARGIVVLNLYSAYYMGKGALIRLARSTNFPRLQTLLLGGLRITDAAVTELTRSQTLPSLKNVQVREDYVSEAGLRMLRGRFGKGLLIVARTLTTSPPPAPPRNPG